MHEDSKSYWIKFEARMWVITKMYQAGEISKRLAKQLLATLFDEYEFKLK